jgi:predicted  nucleic acid-binding Zn-ribbon protein
LITLPQLETLLTEKSRNEQLILKTNEALMAYASELKRIKKVLFAAAG